MALDNIIFFDIETVSGEKSFADVDARLQGLWSKKMQRHCDQNDCSPAEVYSDQAGLNPVFGKIVCITIGKYREKHGNNEFVTKTFCGTDEKALLEEFAEVAKNRGASISLCGHNSIGFDIPYLARRMLVHKIKLPPVLQLHGKKPREIPHIDTMFLWQFGARDYASLDQLAAIFGIPSPKDDIDGSQVTEVFWGSGDVDRIATYCEKDVRVTAKVYCALTQQYHLIPHID